jgi:hypothetical protein
VRSPRNRIVAKIGVDNRTELGEPAWTKVFDSLGGRGGPARRPCMPSGEVPNKFGRHGRLRLDKAVAEEWAHDAQSV